MNTFANNLKKFRLQKEYTQEQVADILGVSSHTVSRWECNTTLPDVTILPEIAKLYCVSIDDLYKESSVAHAFCRRLLSGPCVNIIFCRFVGLTGIFAAGCNIARNRGSKSPCSKARLEAGL